MESPSATPPRGRGRRRSRRARLGWKKIALVSLSGVLLIAIAMIAWVSVRAFIARGELEAAIPLAGMMQRQVVAGDGEAVRATGAELAERASAAAGLTSDPIWRSFEAVPALGSNLRVVRELAAIVDDLATDGILPLSEVAGGISVADFRPVDGIVDLQPLINARPAVAAAAGAIQSAQDELRTVDTVNTLDDIAGAATTLGDAIAEVEPAINALDRAVRIAPLILGAEGPRDYAVLFQNPAELRSSGGIVGAVALIHTENGSIQLAQQASGAGFPGYTDPVLELPMETRGLYGDRTGRFMLNVGLTPNFALSARLAQEMWRLEYGVQVDGVLSIDPVALGYVLEATGPIALPSGDVLTSENAVSLLLSDVYQRYENPADQDAFFSSAAAAVFSAVAGGAVDPVTLITALSRAGDEHRVSVWSASEVEQAILADTTLAGSIPVSDSETQRFGLYINDATGAKMDTYLDVKTKVGQITCRDDLRPTYSIEVALTNTAPGDAGTAFPWYVTGGGVFGVPPGNVKSIVSVYSAADTQNLGLTQDGQVVPYLPATDDGFQVSALTVELAPGQSTIIRYSWLGAAEFDGELELHMTPVIHRNETQKLEMTC